MSVSVDARRYARIRYRVLLVDLIGWLAFLWAYQSVGFSTHTARWASTFSSVGPVTILVYLAVFGGCSYVVFFPLHLYRDFLLEHRFGLSRLTFAGWLVREAKRLALSAVFGALLIEGLYALLREAPSAWPWYAAAGWVGINVVVARIFPTVVLPLFYKTEALDDDALVRRLVALCRRVGVSALGVFRLYFGVETRKANAALAGLGKTRRVLLSDTLLERFTEEEIETVLAHELGHHQHRHITKLLLLSGLGSWLAFVLVDASATWWLARLDVQGLADIAGFPALMLCLSLIGLVGLPIQSAVSRRFEWQADRFAVTTTKLPAAFASALKKLGELNLADPNPPAWVEAVFYDHPAISKRIAAAEAATR